MAPIPEPIPVATAVRAGQQRGEAGADLAGRALPSSRTARADGQRRGHDLDDDGPKANASGVVMHSRDGGVGAMSFGIGREPEDEEGAEQRPGADNERQRPGARERRRRCMPAFSDRSRHVVAGQDAQEQVGGSEESLVEDDGTRAGHGADQDSEHQPLLQIGGARQPSRRPGHRRPP